MADVAVERYKKAVQRVLENFEKKCRPVAKELSEKAEELKEKQKIEADTVDNNR